jgi:glycogen debranching enzyme
MFAIEDLSYNCILIRANQHIKEIAKSLRFQLPEDLLESMNKTEAALEQLWDPLTTQYYSRNFYSHELLKEPSIASLMPLYAGIVSKERAKQIVKTLENKHLYGPTYPVPSAPLNSPWFYEKGYWQGPTWINTNWMIIDGLRRLGFKSHSEALSEATIELVNKSGMNEYFSPVNGEPCGSDNFSWTAALIIDLVSQK